MAINYAAAYANNKVQTANKAERTLILYDAGIKFVNRAISALDKKDMQQTHNNIIKAEKVIEEFRSTLDFKYEVANDFERLYAHMNRTLLDANVKKDKELLEKVLTDFKDLREIWVQIMKQTK